MTVRHPTVLTIEPGRIPEALPQNLDDVKPPLAIGKSGSNRLEPTTLFLTVDVEDSYFNRPILMSGDGIGQEFGVFGVLDELDRHGFKGTFFVNVYEKDRQPKGVVENVVREIAARGHEVGLHTHPSPTLDFYCRPLFRLSRVAQVTVLRWGVDLIAKWTGERPTSFRAGGYALNDDTFDALDEVGIAIDSSCFFSSPNNHNTKHTVNAVSSWNEVIEVPITSVLRATGKGHLEHRKLDIDWLSVDELDSALAAIVSHRARYAMFMMHSFSFIDKRTRRPDEEASPRARFVSDVHLDRYVEVYGPKPAMRVAFAEFLERLVINPAVRVSTLRDALIGLRAVVTADDVVPLVGLGKQ